jgi:hypothetical protein
MECRRTEVAKAVPRLKWSVLDNRYIGTIEGKDEEDCPFAIKARLDLRVVSMGGWFYGFRIDEALDGDTFEERLESLKDFFQQEIDNAEDESRNWACLAKELRGDP